MKRLSTSRLRLPVRLPTTAKADVTVPATRTAAGPSRHAPSVSCLWMPDRRHRFVEDDRGIALVMALLIVAALSISTASIATLVTSNEHFFGRDRQETLAFNTAEAGVNYAIATLAQGVDPC